ncbi:MAG: ABC transporter ATP-binding protein [Candidatus Methanomethylophilaceae archaeon]
MRIEVNDLSQGYDTTSIFDDISFETDSGEIVALLGPNGSGKSTLIKTICNIMPPRSGRVLINGTDVSDYDVTDLAKILSYVPQSSTSAVYTTVMDTVLLGRRPYISWSYREKDIDYAIDAMKKMKVEKYSDRNVSELSVGQRQRVLLARSLAQCPSFFILDEPTSALDLKHQMNTMITMRDIVHDNNAGMIVALHDINLALNYSDKVLMLKDKHIFASGRPRETITQDTIRSVYGVECKIVEMDEGRFILPLFPCDTEDGNDD